MKNIHLKTIIIGFLLVLSAQSINAQFDVYYGQTRRYMFWPMPTIIPNSTNHTEQKQTDNILYDDCPGGTYTGANPSTIRFYPFQFYHNESNTTCTIYGFAAPIVNWGGSEYTDPYTLDGSTWTEECTIETYLYNVTDGDSVLIPLMTKPATFHVVKGKAPDHRLILSDTFVVDVNTYRRCVYLHEFYFDTPITVTGEFILGIKTDQGTAIAIPYFEELNGHRLPISPPYLCSPGYEGCIILENSQIQYKASCSSGRWVQTNIFPDIESESIYSLNTQAFYPILVPEGTVLGIEGSKESPSVIRLLPNPSRSITTIQSDHPINAITLTDLLGRTLISKTCHNEETSVPIDISGLPVGIYTVKVQTSQGTATEKLLVK